MSFLEEIQRRRTFGIISHPDAGKTTLTEKLLLFGGAIQEAGAVKNNKIKKGATSDFMEIERQRGISVATSVLAFIYRDKKINILDTPGHKDFAEDTFRTLTAVDSVIVVIDVAKGVEAQTEKLVEVCRMRKIPIIVFINKLDREGKDAFDLLDEVEQKLGLTVTPMSFPIGMGYDFKGIYNLYEKKINLFSNDQKTTVAEGIEFTDIESPELDEIVGEDSANTLREELEMVEGVYPAFSQEEYLSGDLQPVFFGSILACILNTKPVSLSSLESIKRVSHIFGCGVGAISTKQSKSSLIPKKTNLLGLYLKYMPIWIRNIGTDLPLLKLFLVPLREISPIYM